MKFANRLTHEDIKQLVPFYHYYDFEECPSAQPELRHFKIQPMYGGPYEDVTIGDRFEMGTVRLYGVKEDAFIGFMIDKFGKEYVEWFVTDEHETAEKEIKDFFESRMAECSRRMNICMRLLCKSYDGILKNVVNKCGWTAK